MKNKKDTTELDKKNWDEYIKNPKDIFDKDLNSNSNYSKSKIYRFDLHGYTLLEANIKVKEIILFCLEKNYTEILLITGKGIHSNSDQDIYASKNFSKLKYSVPEFIKSNPNISKYIISIASANQSDGGEGALILKIKNL